MTGAAKGRKGNGHEKSSRRGCRFAAAGIVIFAATVASPDPVPPLPGTVVRTVEVSPDARKRKAFPLDQGSGLCDLHLDPVDPWRIRRSWIELQDDQTLWRKVNDYEYQMSYGYAPNEYVVVKGELYKPSAGPGRVPVKLPEFLVTVPKVNLDWDAKHGEASKEHAEDLVPAAILVSPDQADFGTLVVHGPKDDFGISSPDVTLTWDNANKVKVFNGANEIHSGQKFFLMQGVTVALSVQALAPADDVKFTLEGEPDNVDGEKAVDVVHCLPVKIELVTPAGDPVNAPVDSGDGQNEFTYSSANPGVLTMNLKAKVTPAQAADRIKDDCLFTVGAIGASAMTWANANPGGKAGAVGGFLAATVTFTGLPARNSDFGKKVAEISYKGRTCDRSDYEVFFPKTAANHPGGQAGSPNWFHYWAGEAVPGYELLSGLYSFAWGNPDDYAEYNGNPQNPHFTIHGPASAGHEKYSSAGLVVDRRGIDTCAATLRHEKQHRQTDLDWLPGGAWFMKHDSDGDELPDDWEDSHAGFNKFNASSFSPPFIYGDDEEVWCEMNALNERGCYDKDWANPGKQSHDSY